MSAVLSVWNEDNEPHFKESIGGESFSRAIERIVGFSLTQRGDEQWSIFVLGIAREGVTFSSNQRDGEWWSKYIFSRVSSSIFSQ
jgi:hypothetical protein